MSNGTPPTTIEGWPALSTGRIGLVPPNVAAHLYQPNAPSGLVPALDVDQIEEYPVFATMGVGIASDAGVWIYQPNVPYGMIEIIPSLQPPANVTPPQLTYVTGGGGPGNVGSVYQCTNGTWTPSTPTPTYTRQWLRDGNPISGATATVYTIATADIGSIIGCAVVATNPAGSSNPFPAANPVGPIPDPTPPDDPPPDEEMTIREQLTQQQQTRPKTKPQKHGKGHHAGPIHRRGAGASKR